MRAANQIRSKLSWLERYLDMVEVPGSSPVMPTKSPATVGLCVLLRPIAWHCQANKLDIVYDLVI